MPLLDFTCTCFCPSLFDFVYVCVYCIYNLFSYCTIRHSPYLLLIWSTIVFWEHPFLNPFQTTPSFVSTPIETNESKVNVLVQHKADVTWRPHKKKEPLLHSPESQKWGEILPPKTTVSVFSHVFLRFNKKQWQNHPTSQNLCITWGLWWSFFYPFPMIPAPQVQIPFRIPALKSHCYTAIPLKFTMEPNNQPFKNMNLWITLRKFYIAPENRESQKETHLLTIDFQGRAVKLRGCIELLSSFQKSDASSALRLASQVLPALAMCRSSRLYWKARRSCINGLKVQARMEWDAICGVINTDSLIGRYWRVRPGYKHEIIYEILHFSSKETSIKLVWWCFFPLNLQLSLFCSIWFCQFAVHVMDHWRERGQATGLFLRAIWCGCL